jgi:hypothetical protein
MKTRVAILLLAGLSLSPAQAADPPNFPDLTADQVMTMSGQPPRQSKIYFSAGRMRSEMDMGGKKMASIVDLKAKKMWLLMPEPIGCIEQPFADDPQNPLSASNASPKEELLGSETIDGHPTKKYKVTSTIQGKTYVGYQWRATDLNDFALRWQDEAGKFQTQFKNIVLGKPDPKLLEPPTHCKTGGMSGGMGAPGAGRPPGGKK